MATAIAERIVGKLIAASAVEEVDRELYIYGFFLLITRFFFFLVTVVFGFSLRIPCESVIFYIVFILLRSYAGGIHAKTEMACTIWTTLAMGTATVTIKVLKASSAKLPLCFLLCNVCLLAFSPLGNRGKPLDASERCRYRKVCIGLIVAFDMVAIIANFIVIPTFYYPVICGMCLEAILLCIGKMCNM
jgi:accessory gene regulator B